MNTFLIIALLTFSFTNSFEFASLAEVSEINASPYGKSLLETISLSLEQKGNVNEVEKLLNDLLYKLNQDQANDTAAWNIENARLKAKIKNLENAIEKLRLHILKLEAKRAKYVKLRNKARKNLAQYREQRASNDRALARNTKRRADDKEEFEKSQAEHTDVINALSVVIKELLLLVGSASGPGPKHVRQNAEEKRDQAERLKHAFVQISKDEAEIQSFIQTATQADQRALAELIAALRKIRQSTKKSLNDDRNHEEISVRTYNRLQELLKNDNKKLNSMIIHEKANLKRYIREVNRLTNKIAEEKKLKLAKEAELAATIKEREAKEARYLADKAQRDEERRVIQRIQKIVEKRLANMSKYLNSHV